MTKYAKTFKEKWGLRAKSKHKIHQDPMTKASWSIKLDPRGTLEWQDEDHCPDELFPSNLGYRFRLNQWRLRADGDHAKLWTHRGTPSPRCRHRRSCSGECTMRYHLFYMCHPELICWRAEAAGRDTVMVNFEFSNDGDTAKALACFHCIITKNGTCEFVGICTVKIHAVGPGEEANIEVKMNTSEKAKRESAAKEAYLNRVEGREGMTLKDRMALIEVEARDFRQATEARLDDLEEENERLKTENKKIRIHARKIRELKEKVVEIDEVKGKVVEIEKLKEKVAEVQELRERVEELEGENETLTSQNNNLKRKFARITANLRAIGDDAHDDAPEEARNEEEEEAQDESQGEAREKRPSKIIHL